MALETTLETTNTLLAQLLAVLTTGLEAQQSLGEPEKKTRTRKTKDTTEGEGAAEGSTYWLIEKHNTVYEQKPGDPGTSIEGAVKVTREVYEAKKAEFAKKPEVAETNQPKTTADASPAGSPEVKPEAGGQTAGSAVTYDDIFAVMKDINTSKAAGHGREGVTKVLTQFGKAKVPELATCSDLAAVLAFAKSVLAPAPAEDDLGL